MKLELIKPMGKMKAGEILYPRSDEQATMIIEQGFANQVEDDPIVEKELVLINPEPGTYTTGYIDKSAAVSNEVSSSDAIVLTAKEMIEKVNAATTVEEVKSIVPDTETRKTVKDAAAKKIEDLSAV